MSAETIPDALENLTVDIDSLTPYSANPREGDIGAICVSLEANGQYRPIVVNSRDNVILAGNHTWHAARKLGWTRIAATFVDADDTLARRIVLVDNRANDLASYDDQALVDLLSGLVAEQGVEGLWGTGFDGDALDDLLGDLAPEPEGLNDPDEVPDPPAEPTSKLGDVWLCGKHRVVCGDSTDPQVLDAAYSEATVGALLTDPPYGMHLDTDFSKTHKDGGSYRPVHGDDEDFDPAFHLAYFEDVDEQWWWGADYYRDKIPMGGSWLVWDKREHETMDLSKVHGAHFELAWSRQKHQRRMLRYLWSGHYGMQGEDTRKRVHPTQKPVAMLVDMLERWTPEGCVVADPFGGSGSTLLAAHRTGRVARLVEIDPSYVDVICRRYQEHTGDKPILEATGEPHDFTSA